MEQVGLAATADVSLWSLFMQAGLVVKLVMVGLIAASIWTWAIVVDKTLAGDGGSIKAYSIAVDVLGRPPDFDPQNDPIVRVQARRLRNLLEQFYAGGLSKSGVEIRLPLGRYVPEFRLAGTPVEESGPAIMTADKPPARSHFLSNAILALIFTLVGVVLAVAMVLSPDAGEHTLGALNWALQPGATAATAAASTAAGAFAENATSDALPLFERIANGDGTVTLALGDRLGLKLAWGAR